MDASGQVLHAPERQGVVQRAISGVREAGYQLKLLVQMDRAEIAAWREQNALRFAQEQERRQIGALSSDLMDRHPDADIVATALRFEGIDPQGDWLDTLSERAVGGKP